MRNSTPHSDLTSGDMDTETVVLVSHWRGSLARIALVTLCLVAATFGILQFIPRTFHATAVLGTAGQLQDAGEADLRRVRELATRPEVLVDAIDAHNLRTWPEFTGSGPLGLLLQLSGRKPDVANLDERARQRLAERVSVLSGAAAGEVLLSVRSGDAALAADLANTLATDAIALSGAAGIDDSGAEAARLRQQIEQLRAELATAEAAVADYRRKHDLVDVTEGQSSRPSASVADEIASVQQRRREAEARATEIRNFAGSGRTVDSIPDLRDSALIRRLVDEAAGLQADLAEKSTRLLGNHPAIKSLRAQIAEVQSRIAIESGRIADSVASEAQAAAELERRLEAELARARNAEETAAQDAASASPSLDSLQRAAEQQRVLLQTYTEALARLEAGPTNTAAGLTLLSAATPAESPDFPNTPLALLAVALAAIAVQLALLTYPDLRRSREPAAAVPVGATQTEEAADPTLDAAIAALVQEDVAETVELPPPASEPLDATVAEPAADAVTEDLAADGADHLDEEFSPVAARAVVAPDEEIIDAIEDGRLRVLLLATLDGTADADPVIAALVEDVLSLDLSAVIVDACSAARGPVAGLADLAAGRADYGDVVHDLADNLAEVPWGRRARLDPDSTRPVTLVAALADIYHSVLVDAGTIDGMGLELFSGANAAVLLIVGRQVSPERVRDAEFRIAGLGYALAATIQAPRARADVA